MGLGSPESRKAEQQADEGHGAREAQCTGMLLFQHLRCYGLYLLAEWQDFSTVLQKCETVRLG